MFDSLQSPASKAQKAGVALADRDVRYLAVMFDQGILGMAVLPLVIAFSIASPVGATESTVVTMGWLLFFAAALGISVLQWWLLTTQGQTLGKMALGIRVQRPDGSLADFVRVVVLRSWLVTVLSGLFWGLFALADALAIFSSDRRTVHDRFADTIVVRVGGGQLR